MSTATPEPPLRTRSRWGYVMLSAVLGASGVAAAILFIVIGGGGASDPGGPAGRMPGGAAAPAMAADEMPATMHRQSQAPPAKRAATRRVRVELGEMYVKPSVRSVPAGKVTFVVRNVGEVEHELIVSGIPVKMEAPGMPDHDAGLGMTEHMAAGMRETLTLRMKPGTYELFCNVPGHYAAGQKTKFTVRKS